MATFRDRWYRDEQNWDESAKFRHYLTDYNDYKDKTRLIWEMNVEFHLRPEDFVKYTFLEKRFKVHLSQEDRYKLGKLYSLWESKQRRE